MLRIIRQREKIRVLIVPKFEIGAMSRDFPGEAQLFYERYCAGCGEIEMPNFPPTAHFYLNDENGVGILVTGSGKTAAGLSLMALLSSDRYDCSSACIVSVGCGGGSLSVSRGSVTGRGSGILQGNAFTEGRVVCHEPGVNLLVSL